jgi:uncharacterized protein (DUF305 family)
MEKNKNAIQSALFIIVGVFVGWLIWGGVGVEQGMHKMPNGDTMSDMGHMMDEMNAGLVGKTGDDFDKAFIDEMIVHHQGAIDMAEMVLAVSKRPELIKLANDIITAQTAEIEMMSMWRTEWFAN